MDNHSHSLGREPSLIVKKTVWKNIDMSTVKLGIAREKMKSAVRGEEIGDFDLRQLIDPSMLILSDLSIEPKMDVLLTARNNLWIILGLSSGCFMRSMRDMEGCMPLRARLLIRRRLISLRGMG